MRSTRAFTWIMLFVGTAGCASGGVSGPTSGPGQSASARIRLGDGNQVTTGISTENRVSRVALTVTPEIVFSRLGAVYDSIGVQVNAADRRSFTMAAEDVRLRRIAGGRPSRFLDCGRNPAGANADHYDVYLTVITQVTPDRASGSELGVQVVASARDASSGGAAVRCQSNGSLEALIAEKIQESLSDR
jgi:hypothetical protein